MGGGGRVTICRDARKRLAEGRPYKRVTRLALIQRTHRSCVPTKGYSSRFDTTDAQIVRPYKGLLVCQVWTHMLVRPYLQAGSSD